jgi:hypothetical protein
MTSTYRSAGGAGYRLLCAEAERTAGIVKLGHGPQGWTLQVVLTPTSDDPACRAAGAIFPTIDELDDQAVHLLAWVRTCRRDAARTEAP